MRKIVLGSGRTAVIGDSGRVENYFDAQGSYEGADVILPGDEQRELADKLEKTRHEIRWDQARTATNDPGFPDAVSIIRANLPPELVARAESDPGFFAHVYPRARQMVGVSVAEQERAEWRQRRIAEIEQDMAMRAESRHGASLNVDQMAELAALREEEKNGNG